MRKYTFVLVTFILLFSGPAFGQWDNQGGKADDTAYGVSWDGSKKAATQNALYDIISALGGGHDAITLDANAQNLLTLTDQALGIHTQVANRVYAGPTTGADAVPTFRALVAEDIPTLNQNTTGTAAGLTAQYIDWNAVSGGASIANKPTLGTMAAATATDYVAKALFDANTILYATTDNTPAALTVAEQRVVGRATGGDIAALTLGNAAGNVAQWPADPGAHTLFGFDNTDNIYRNITIGSGLTYTQATATLSATGGGFSVTDITSQTDDTTPATTATAVLAQGGSLIESTLAQIGTSIGFVDWTADQGATNIHAGNVDTIGALITGYSSGAGTVAATDTILQAINKLNGNNDLKLNIANSALTGDATLTDATPTFICNDSTNAAGTCGFFANSSGGANDMIWSFGVEDSTGASTEYFQIDGVTETIDFLKPVTLASGWSITGSTSGGQYMFLREDTDNTADNYSGWGIYGELAHSTIYALPLAAPAAGQVMSFAAPGNQTMSDGSTQSVSAGSFIYPKSTYNATADGMADDNYNGDTIIGRNCGENLTQWDTVRIVNDADPWHQADADAAGEFPAIGITVAACTDTNPAIILVKGVVRNEGWTGLTPGGKVYLSDSVGGITQTPPATSGDCVQVIGWALSDSEIYFDFSRPYLELE